MKTGKKKQSEEWNAWIVVPMLIGVGIGIVGGISFSMGKPPYVAWIGIGVGFLAIVVGVITLRQLQKETYPTQSDEEIDNSDRPQKREP